MSTSQAKSSPSPTTAASPPAPFLNLLKQFKFIAVGSLLLYLGHGLPLLTSRLDPTLGSSVGKTSAVVSLVLLSLTVGFFGVLMLLPLRGYPPNYPSWQTDPHLRLIIPSLSLSLVVGFLVLFLTLSPLVAPFSSSLLNLAQREQEIGYIPALLTSIGVYLAVLGSVGLLGCLTGQVTLGKPQTVGVAALEVDSKGKGKVGGKAD